MGNTSSNTTGNGGGNRRRQNSRRNHPQPPPQPTPQPQQPPEMSANRFVFAAATPYPSAGYYQYHPPAPGYYPPPPPPPPHSMPMPLPAPYDHHHQPPNWGGAGRYHYGQMVAPPHPGAATAAAAPYVEHQKAVTIRNDVNLKKETLRVEADEENPGMFLVAFTFDATVAGRLLGLG